MACSLNINVETISFLFSADSELETCNLPPETDLARLRFLGISSILILMNANVSLMVDVRVMQITSRLLKTASSLAHVRSL